MLIVETPFTRTNGLREAFSLGGPFSFFNFLFGLL